MAERMIPPGYMTVGEVAKKMGVTVRTLQYYDREGLLSPSAESEGGRRLYADKDVIKPVSYTHLDVYKRQGHGPAGHALEQGVGRVVGGRRGRRGLRIARGGRRGAVLRGLGPIPRHGRPRQAVVQPKLGHVCLVSHGRPLP